MPSVTSQLIVLFQSHRIFTCKQLQKQLARSRRSLFRDLCQLGALSSYTHGGQYHTLPGIPQFNSEGLWFYQQVGFSQYGTLKSTLIQLSHKGQVGYTHKELKSRLQILVYNTLLELVKLKKIKRHLLEKRHYVYVSIDEQTAKNQLARRVAMKNVRQIHLPSESIQIEVFAEVIRTHGIDVDSQQLAEELEARGIPISDKEIDNMVAFYDIKKNGVRNPSAHPSEN